MMRFSSQQTIEALKVLEGIIDKVETETIEEFGSGMIRDVLSYNESRYRRSDLGTIG